MAAYGRSGAFLLALPLVWLLQLEALTVSVMLIPVAEVLPFSAILMLAVLAWRRREPLRRWFVAIAALAGVTVAVELAAFPPLFVMPEGTGQRFDAVLAAVFTMLMGAMGIAHIALFAVCALTFLRGTRSPVAPAGGLLFAAPALLGAHVLAMAAVTVLEDGALAGVPWALSCAHVAVAAVMLAAAWRMRGRAGGGAAWAGGILLAATALIEVLATLGDAPLGFLGSLAAPLYVAGVIVPHVLFSVAVLRGTQARTSWPGDEAAPETAAAQA